MKRIKYYIRFIVLFLLMLILTACLPNDGTHNNEKLAGFFWGIWHGWVAPISLIISLFKGNIGIYEVFNNGFWYNFGYYIAIISGFGSLSFSRRCRKDRYCK